MKKLIPMIWAALLLLSCTTLQDDLVVQSSGSMEFQELETIELELAALMDPQFMGDYGVELEDIQERLFGLEQSSMNLQYLADLYSLQAWAAWLKGQKRQAENLLEEAQEQDPRRELVLLVQAYLLEDPQEALDYIGANELEGFIRLELRKGWVLFQLGQFGEALAAFDKSMADLPQEYRNIYQEYRDKAWELKDSDIQGEEGLFLSDEPITLDQMVEITLQESLLLDEQSRQNQLNSRELFEKLQTTGYILSDKDRNRTVDRGDGALFIWMLYLAAENKEDQVNIYSTRFNQSPIEDVPVDSPYFDAVLGCVEREFMALPDGQLFYPDLLLNGLDYLEILQALMDY